MGLTNTIKEVANLWSTRAEAMRDDQVLESILRRKAPRRDPTECVHPGIFCRAAALVGEDGRGDAVLPATSQPRPAQRRARIFISKFPTQNSNTVPRSTILL